MTKEKLKPIDVSKYTVTESGNVIKDIRDKLKQEAEEYVCKRNPLVTKKWFIDAFKKYDKGEKVKYLKDCEIAEYEAYIAGAEPREKRIEELEDKLSRVKNILLSYIEWEDAVTESKVYVYEDIFVNAINEIEK